MTRIGSACSGYGGLEMGLRAVIGGTVAWHVEYDKAPSAVLATRYPDVPNYGDVTTTDWSQLEPVDWFTAGFPCQPASTAGKRKGMTDERWLWDAVANAVAGVRPRWVLLENVPGLLTVDGGRAVERVICDLASLGYVGRYGVVRAADAGAPHGRARVFILASDTDRERHERSGSARRWRGGPADDSQPPADADQPRPQGGEPAGRRLMPARGSTPDAAGDGRDEGWTEPARVIGRPDAAIGCPGVHYCKAALAGGGVCDSRCPLTDAQSDTGREQHGEHPSAPADASCRPCEPQRARTEPRIGGPWGAYAPALHRWEAVLGRPAPRPTEPGRNGERLSPAFVEWMMGLPDGWVTDLGLPRNAQLKMLGNGCVPQQVALAVRTLVALAVAA